MLALLPHSDRPCRMQLFLDMDDRTTIDLPVVE